MRLSCCCPGKKERIHYRIDKRPSSLFYSCRRFGFFQQISNQHNGLDIAGSNACMRRHGRNTLCKQKQFKKKTEEILNNGTVLAVPLNVYYYLIINTPSSTDAETESIGESTLLTIREAILSSTLRLI